MSGYGCGIRRLGVPCLSNRRSSLSDRCNVRAVCQLLLLLLLNTELLLTIGLLLLPLHLFLMLLLEHYSVFALPLLGLVRHWVYVLLSVGGTVGDLIVHTRSGGVTAISHLWGIVDDGCGTYRPRGICWTWWVQGIPAWGRSGGDSVLSSFSLQDPIRVIVGLISVTAVSSAIRSV